MQRNYFVCSIGEPGKGYDAENLLRCIENMNFVLHEDTIRKGAIEEIKIGDLLILKYQEHLIAYGQVISNLDKKTDLSEGEGWAWSIKVNRWILGKHIHIYGIKDAQEGGTNYDTVKKVERDYALQKVEEIGLIL
jgi:hypothetical protein